jgi:hypothetical protein
MSTSATGDDAQTCFESLEEGQCILKQQSIAISQNLTRINEALECLTRQCRADETMVHGGDTLVEVSSTTLSVTATKQQKLKPSQPLEFNGNCTKGSAFINSCMLYTTLCPEEFTDNIQQICWVLTFHEKKPCSNFRRPHNPEQKLDWSPLFPYVNDFEELIDLSGYTDPLAIVIKFHRGLNAMIQNKIVELGKDHPRDNSPAAWYTMA